MAFDAGTGYLASASLKPGVGALDFFQGTFAANIPGLSNNGSFTMITATSLNTVLLVHGSAYQVVIAPEDGYTIAVPTLNLFAGPIPIPIVASWSHVVGANLGVWLSFRLDVVTIIENNTGVPTFNVNLGFITQDGSNVSIGGRNISGRVTCSMSNTS
jgi:hypothetical protein